MNHIQGKLQRDGRAAYKREDYAAALELFNKAIGRAPSVLLHDNRAACYVKLNDLPAALKDAKKAIQLQREDPTGYLRAGKVLLRMEQQSVALEIYIHGLKSIKHAGKGYELLRKAHGELQSQLSPPKSVDPLTQLPPELAEMVLEYLSFRQRMNACLVSKQWANFIRSTPNLWRHLDLSGARRKVPNKFISRAINVAGQKLCKATLHEVYDLEKALPALIRHCALVELVLGNTGSQCLGLINTLQSATCLKILRLTSGTRITETEVDKLFNNLGATLESFECELKSPILFEGFSIVFANLKHLKISVTHGFETMGGANSMVRRIATRMLNLQSLIVIYVSPRLRVFETYAVDLRPLTSLEHLHLDGIYVNEGGLKLPPGIKRLFISVAPHRTIRHEWRVAVTHLLPYIMDLSISVQSMSLQIIHDLLAGDADQIQPAEAAQFQSTATVDTSCTQAQPLSRLSALSLDGFYRYEAVYGADAVQLLQHPRLRHLQQLRIPPFFLQGDTWADAIANGDLPDLRTVDCSGSEITGIGVKALVQTGCIRHLVLNDCRRLGRDAVDWARTQGVTVESRNTNVESGGKKLRHG